MSKFPLLNVVMWAWYQCGVGGASEMFSCFFFQTAEEIDQLTVDEDLNDVERAVYLLR